MQNKAETKAPTMEFIPNDFEVKIPPQWEDENYDPASLVLQPLNTLLGQIREQEINAVPQTYANNVWEYDYLEQMYKSQLAQLEFQQQNVVIEEKSPKCTKNDVHKAMQDLKSRMQAEVRGDFPLKQKCRRKDTLKPKDIFEDEIEQFVLLAKMDAELLDDMSDAKTESEKSESEMSKDSESDASSEKAYGLPLKAESTEFTDFFDEKIDVDANENQMEILECEAKVEIKQKPQKRVKCARKFKPKKRAKPF